MTLREKAWGFEIKSKTSVNSRDAKGLIKLANVCGKDFQKASCSTEEVTSSH